MSKLQRWKLYSEQVKQATADTADDCYNDRQSSQSFIKQGASIATFQDLQSTLLGNRDAGFANDTHSFGLQKAENRVKIRRSVFAKCIKWDKILVLKNTKSAVVYCTTLIRRTINKIFNIK